MARKMQIGKNSMERAILIALIGGAIVFSPMSGKIVVGLARYYLEKWWEKGGPYIPPENDVEQVRASIYKLKRNDYIKWKYDKQRSIIKLELTPKGEQLFEQIKLDDITISIPRQWDGLWRFVLFDVPEKRRNYRDILRDKLKNLGFFQFQKSVWIYPFECGKEVRYLCEYWGITSYTIMFTVKIDNDRILRRYFLKQGILLKQHLSLFDKGIRY